MMIKKTIVSFFTLLTFLFSFNAIAIELNFAQGGGSQGKMTMELTAEWEKKTGHKVNFLEMPASTSDQYVQYKTWLSAQNSDVDIYKVVTEGPYIYLAMELVEGETLQQRVDSEGPLAGPLLWFTAQGLVEALSAIHDAGITHRDLKPSNVMFGPDGVKVLDFGISAAAEETGLTQTGAFLGTAAWISPEQILGREVTEKCDVFNLGLVMGFASTGRHPYGDGRPDAVMYRISNLGPDLEEIPEHIKKDLSFHFAKEVMDVIDVAIPNLKK